ncbi:NERD domain-containing protein [Mycoplasmopsis mucosicanis]|uniref:NERD domain-containing protein n=1 Tax=Mycoplasmopsis mucosicanis TaxID=458208 RepID=A0A507SJG1_9BACT|nr:nuclease-related domain-containing protein [Mycoplasmopsis mucosicanis]TQC51361.1 NERD domain-containing protein [Mycoplasmopsis mucosicanis]
MESNLTQLNFEKINPLTYEQKIGIILGTIIMSLILIGLLSLYITLHIKNKRRDTEGFAFEDRIANLFQDFAKKNEFKFIGAKRFMFGDGNQFEIDGILYCRHFIMIVEVKYLKGMIEGFATDDKITISNKNKKRRFNNPITQNFRHIRHFQKMTRTKIPCFSLLVLPEFSSYEIKNNPEWNIVANDVNFVQVIEDVYNDFKVSVPLKNDEIEDMLQAVREYEVKSLKALKKWEKGLKDVSR